MVLNKGKDGTYAYNETPTNANYVEEFKKLIEDAIDLNNIVERTALMVRKTHAQDFANHVDLLDKDGALFPTETTQDRTRYLKLMLEDYTTKLAEAEKDWKVLRTLWL